MSISKLVNLMSISKLEKFTTLGERLGTLENLLLFPYSVIYCLRRRKIGNIRNFLMLPYSSHRRLKFKINQGICFEMVWFCTWKA